MKKIGLLIIPLLIFLSCSKESLLPDEYQYLVGNWVLDNYVVELDSQYLISDSLPADSLGYELSIKIDDHSIQYFSETTLVQKVDDYIDIQMHTGTYSGESSMFFSISYRDALGVKKSTSICYVPSKDFLRVYYHLFDSESGTYYGPRYQFNYSRN